MKPCKRKFPRSEPIKRKILQLCIFVKECSIALHTCKGMFSSYATMCKWLFNSSDPCRGMFSIFFSSDQCRGMFSSSAAMQIDVLQLSFNVEDYLQALLQCIELFTSSASMYILALSQIQGCFPRYIEQCRCEQVVSGVIVRGFLSSSIF